MATRRRKYSIEFKQEAVRLVREDGLTDAQVGRDLGDDRGVLRSWVQKDEAGQLAPQAAANREMGTAIQQQARAERGELTRERMKDALAASRVALQSLGDVLGISQTASGLFGGWRLTPTHIDEHAGPRVDADQHAPSQHQSDVQPNPS